MSPPSNLDDLSPAELKALGLAKTCAKLGISFWDYLGARLVIAGNPAIPYLPQLVAQRCSTA